MKVALSEQRSRRSGRWRTGGRTNGLLGGHRGASKCHLRSVPCQRARRLKEGGERGGETSREEGGGEGRGECENDSEP